MITKSGDGTGKRAKSEGSAKGGSNVHKLAENLKKSLDQAPAPGPIKRPGWCTLNHLIYIIGIEYFFLKITS